MNWLYKLFSKNEDEEDATPESAEAPQGNSNLSSTSVFEGLEGIRFGRYSDNNKSKAKTQSWYKAEDRFKEKKYTEALEAFFEYLRDDEDENVNVKQDGDKFVFTILQGSKKVHGEIDGDLIKATSPLATMQQPHTAVMRRLLEINYSLYYSHSGMDADNTLHMVFTADVPSTNPSKLYYGLRELATKADRQDDLLISDFSSLTPTDQDHVTPLPEKELDIKYKYFRQWIEQTLARIGDLNQDSFSGAIAYLLLTLIYRIDFLLQPESRLLTELEKINGFYWDKKDELALVERNQMMKEGIRKLLDLSREDFGKSFFRSKSTFSIATPPKADKVRDHIVSANRDSNWYVENKYPDIALVITEYGLVYNQFLYSMPKLQTDLIRIYMAVMHAAFFAELGMKTNLYNAQTGILNQAHIVKAIDEAVEGYADKFKSMKWEHDRISYRSLYEFGIDFSEQIASLNLETKREG